MNVQQTKNKAAVCLKEGRFQEAKTLYQRVCTHNKRDAESWYNLGLAAQRLDQLEEAELAFKRACRINPSVPGGYVTLGNVLFSLDKLDEAENCYRQAVDLQPGQYIALNNLGNIALQKGEIEKAESLIVKAIACRPDFVDAYINLSKVHLEADSFAESKSAAEKAISHNRNLPEAYYYLGRASEGLGDLAGAERCYQEAANLRSGYLEPVHLLVKLYREQGNLLKANELVERGLATSPDAASLHADLSLILLQFGDYARGWDEYEWRREVTDSSQRPKTLPEWDDTSLEDKGILVYAEQGIGDEIMFASCLPDLISKSKRVVVECAERLAPLFSRSFPGAEFHGKLQNMSTDWQGNYPDLEVQTLAGSLPRRFRRTEAAFPDHGGYLVPDPVVEQMWKDRFMESGSGLKVGVSWRGGKVPYQEYRSIPLLQWASLMAIPGIQFINLQYGSCQEEISEFSNHTGIALHDWEDSDPLSDLDGFAAQIHALDLVISVDNTTVHMAGALGRPVWTLLPFSHDWRWITHREDSPWYPSARIFTQQTAGQWTDVLADVATALRTFAES